MHSLPDSRGRTLCVLLASAFVLTTVSPRSAGADPERPSAEALHAVAQDLADTWMEKHPPQSMAWSWGEAVLALGLQAVHRATQDPSILHYLQDWVDFHLDRGVRINRNDAVVPATSALYLYDITGDPKYLEVVDQCHAYLDERAPRLSDGAIAHTLVTPRQIWVDSLFMFGTFYTMDGAVTGRISSFDALAEQYGLFLPHLFSSGFGLYRHMYDERVDRTVPTTPTFWGRGNGWALASLAMLLAELPSDHPDRAGLTAAFSTHATAVASWQDVSGLWWTVLNRPGDTYLETSASALNAFALLRGARIGVLDAGAKEVGERALSGLISVITYDDDGDPVVTGISKATNPGPYWMYARVPVGNDEPYGVGAVMMAFEEAGESPSPRLPAPRVSGSESP